MTAQRPGSETAGASGVGVEASRERAVIVTTAGGHAVPVEIGMRRSAAIEAAVVIERRSEAAVEAAVTIASEIGGIAASARGATAAAVEAAAIVGGAARAAAASAGAAETGGASGLRGETIRMIEARGATAARQLPAALQGLKRRLLALEQRAAHKLLQEAQARALLPLPLLMLVLAAKRSASRKPPQLQARASRPCSATAQMRIHSGIHG